MWRSLLTNPGVEQFTFSPVGQSETCAFNTQAFKLTTSPSPMLLPLGKLKNPWRTCRSPSWLLFTGCACISRRIEKSTTVTVEVSPQKVFFALLSNALARTWAGFAVADTTPQFPQAWNGSCAGAMSAKGSVQPGS